jgi:hypothetical protein
MFSNSILYFVKYNQIGARRSIPEAQQYSISGFTVDLYKYNVASGIRHPLVLKRQPTLLEAS